MAIAGITAFFTLQLPKAELDNNIVHFMPENIPARLIVRHLDETFGERVVIFIGLERPYGAVFDRDFLMRIREFTQAVENSELIREVDSIISTQYISGEGDSIIVTNLVADDFSGTSEEIRELKKRIASWDLYQGQSFQTISRQPKSLLPSMQARRNREPSKYNAAS
jgi:predicted RND superfamily exporter protein